MDQQPVSQTRQKEKTEEEEQLPILHIKLEEQEEQTAKDSSDKGPSGRKLSDPNSMIKLDSALSQHTDTTGGDSAVVATATAESQNREIDANDLVNNGEDNDDSIENAKERFA